MVPAASTATTLRVTVSSEPSGPSGLVGSELSVIVPTPVAVVFKVLVILDATRLKVSPLSAI